MRKPLLGELEMEVLNYVADHHPISARQVADQFGEPRGLARTTILTVLENLRTKEYLTRCKQGSVFLYEPGAARNDLLKNLVQKFVESSLGGSVSPIVAYLGQTKQISDEELIELQRLVEGLRDERSRREP